MIILSQFPELFVFVYLQTIRLGKKEAAATSQYVISHCSKVNLSEMSIAVGIKL